MMLSDGQKDFILKYLKDLQEVGQITSMKYWVLTEEQMKAKCNGEVPSCCRFFTQSNGKGGTKKVTFVRPSLQDGPGPKPWPKVKFYEKGATLLEDILEEPANQLRPDQADDAFRSKLKTNSFPQCKTWADLEESLANDRERKTRRNAEAVAKITTQNEGEEESCSGSDEDGGSEGSSRHAPTVATIATAGGQALAAAKAVKARCLAGVGAQGVNRQNARTSNAKVTIAAGALRTAPNLSCDRRGPRGPRGPGSQGP